MRILPARFVSQLDVSETGTGREKPKVMNTDVLKYADGTTRTQDQENRMAWRKAQRVVDALESWGTVASGGPKPRR